MVKTRRFQAKHIRRAGRVATMKLTKGRGGLVHPPEAVEYDSWSPRTRTLGRLDCRVGIVDSPDNFFTTDVRERVHEGR